MRWWRGCSFKRRRFCFRFSKRPLGDAKIFVAVILLGFLVVLILSWAFEITPEGIKLSRKLRLDECHDGGLERRNTLESTSLLSADDSGSRCFSRAATLLEIDNNRSHDRHCKP